jgi:hypothetical protein
VPQSQLHYGTSRLAWNFRQAMNKTLYECIHASFRTAPTKAMLLVWTSNLTGRPLFPLANWQPYWRPGSACAVSMPACPALPPGDRHWPERAGGSGQQEPRLARSRRRSKRPRLVPRRTSSRPSSALSLPWTRLEGEAQTLCKEQGFIHTAKK